MARIPKPKVVSEITWNKICSASSVHDKDYALFCNDSEHALKLIPNDTINTCVTSPPYWSARDYDRPNQIGLEENIEEYIHQIVNVFTQVRRVLTSDGSVWLNLGDCYLHGNSLSNTRKRNKSWQKNKQLSLLPFRVAMALQDDGWWIRNTVVWHKPNAMPSSVRDRLTNVWEPLFLLTKNEQYYFNLDDIRVPHKTDDNIEEIRAKNGSINGKAKGQTELRRWLNSPRHRATIDGLKEVRRRPNAPDPTELAAYLKEAAREKGLTIKDIAELMKQPFERVRHYMRTDKIGSRLPPEDAWEELKELLDLGTEYDDAMAVEVGNNIFRNHPRGRNPGDLISIGLTGTPAGHFAIMPRRLARWALTATLPKGGICLDPFMGTGTSGVETILQEAKFIGIDIREDYLSEFDIFMRQGKGYSLAEEK